MLLQLDEAGFRKRFRKSPIKRIGRVALHRNVCIAMSNSGDSGFVPLLLDALNDEAAMVRAHAAWALTQLAPEDELIRKVVSRAMDKELDQQAYEDIRLTLKEKE
jgi:epoxyqueuosine reductase